MSKLSKDLSRFAILTHAPIQATASQSIATVYWQLLDIQNSRTMDVDKENPLDVKSKER